MTPTSFLTEPTPEERFAHLARKIVIVKLVLRNPMQRVVDIPLAMRPDASDFVEPFRVLMRVELLNVRIDEARISGNEERVRGLRDELIMADRELHKLVLGPTNLMP